MNIKFKLLLLLPLVVCNEEPHETILALPPYAGRLALLGGDIVVLYTFTGSRNYDSYFFAPALVPLIGEHRELLNFFANDFRLKEHANDFSFSETETKQEFATRFLRYIAKANNVPSNIQELAAQGAEFIQNNPVETVRNGFIKPCPLYSFVRAITLLFERHDLGEEKAINNIEVIIKFLLTEFNPQDYNIQDTSNVGDITAFIARPLTEPMRLSDGSLAEQHNKKLFERLVTEESVPQNVKDAIAETLLRM